MDELTQGVAVGAVVGGVVYGLAKWKEEEVKRVFRTPPELLALMTGTATSILVVWTI